MLNVLEDMEVVKAKDEAILANIADGLFFTDLEGRIVLLNKSAEKMLGVLKTEVIGKNCAEVLLINDGKGGLIAKEYLPIQKVLDAKHLTVTADSYYCTKKNGSVFPVAITVSGVDLKNETIGAIVIFRDITKDQTIKRKKNEFVSLASHELRTPLSTVKWYTEMLLAGDAGKITSEQKKYLKEIYTGNQRMVELVKALLKEYK